MSCRIHKSDAHKCASTIIARQSSLKNNEITSLPCDAHTTSIPDTNMEDIYAGLNFSHAGDE